MKVSIIVPAYNEESEIEQTLTALKQTLTEAEIIVVDDCSTDSTATLASVMTRVVTHSVNQGKAGTLQTGLNACHGDVIAMVDADMGPAAGQIATLVEAVVRGDCDMAVALFAASRGGGIGLVSGLAGWGIRLLTGEVMKAPLSGQRAARRQVWEQCLPAAGRFGLETELTVRVLRRGYRVLELPTQFVHTGHGWTARGVCHRGRQFADVLAALWRLSLKWR